MQSNPWDKNNQEPQKSQKSQKKSSKMQENGEGDGNQKSQKSQKSSRLSRKQKLAMLKPTRKPRNDQDLTQDEVYTMQLQLLAVINDANVLLEHQINHMQFHERLAEQELQTHQRQIKHLEQKRDECMIQHIADEYLDRQEDLENIMWLARLEELRRQQEADDLTDSNVMDEQSEPLNSFQVNEVQVLSLRFNEEGINGRRRRIHIFLDPPAREPFAVNPVNNERPNVVPGEDSEPEQQQEREQVRERGQEQVRQVQEGRQVREEEQEGEQEPGERREGENDERFWDEAE